MSPSVLSELIGSQHCTSDFSFVSIKFHIYIYNEPKVITFTRKMNTIESYLQTVISKSLIPTPSKSRSFFLCTSLFFPSLKMLGFIHANGAERYVILHQRVGELGQIRDAHLVTLHIPFSFPHGEVGWDLAVRYQGDVTSHNDV